MTINVSHEHVELIESAISEIQGIGHIMKTLIRARETDPVLLPMRGLGMRLEALAAVIWCSMDDDETSLSSMKKLLYEDGLRAPPSDNEDDQAS